MNITTVLRSIFGPPLESADSKLRQSIDQLENTILEKQKKQTFHPLANIIDGMFER